MAPYIYKRNKDGVHYLDIAKTWEKIQIAARIIAATQDKNRQDVLVSTSFLRFSPRNDCSGHAAATGSESAFAGFLRIKIITPFFRSCLPVSTLSAPS